MDDKARKAWEEGYKKYPALRVGSAQIFEPVILLNINRIYVANNARIDSYSKLEGGSGIIIGEYVHIASFCHIGIGGGMVILEDGASFGSGAKLISGSNVYGRGRGCSAVHPDSIIVRSFVHIKRNATVFAGGVVLPGITIGEGSVLAAGGVANQNIPDGEIWGGVPARKLRNIT